MPDVLTNGLLGDVADRLVEGVKIRKKHDGPTMAVRAVDWDLTDRNSPTVTVRGALLDGGPAFERDGVEARWLIRSDEHVFFATGPRPPDANGTLTIPAQLVTDDTADSELVDALRDQMGRTVLTEPAPPPIVAPPAPRFPPRGEWQRVQVRLPPGLLERLEVAADDRVVGRDLLMAHLVADGLTRLHSSGFPAATP
ncbi:hypothetical protein [Desertimonas flava]|uniref:hypothetical protein n=1 Tax=Desertimonas flava TaxID=2064846 RepID=UPI000E35689B|nr:hypothetical protein [Desertimonas flava]